MYQFGEMADFDTSVGPIPLWAVLDFLGGCDRNETFKGR
jgi:hypothetical protein